MVKQNRIAAFAPIATVFVSSACIMVIELVAGRLVSPYIGQSLYTWTTIIGVVLAGISVGNYLGGRLADISWRRATLAGQLLLAALGCVAVLPINRFVGTLELLMALPWPVRILTHITLVFILPSILLGTISPVIAKRALMVGRSTGRTMGNVYAFAIAGSIAGTFLTGYYLMAWITTTSILSIAAGTLGGLAILYFLGSIILSEEKGMLATAATASEMSPSGKKGSLFNPIATVFIANGCIMMAEIAAGRIISRHYGQSIYAWTTVIGVILAGMTLGSFLGGRWADRFSSAKMLSILFLLSSIACFCVPAITEAVISSQIAIGYSWPMQIAFHVIAAFALPSILLGAVGPVTAAMALAEGRGTGRTVGSIYAWGSVGSIVGTFLAGFYLIAAIGMVMTVFAVAVVLALMAVIHGRGTRVIRFSAYLFLLAPIALLVKLPDQQTLAQRLRLQPVSPNNVVYRAESQYSHIMIVHRENQNIREMILDRLIHSRVNLDDPREIRYEYEWTYTGVLDKYYPPEQPMTALVIGGGGYTYPHYLEVTRPGSYIEVAEIDPEVTEAAYEAFGLPRDTTIKSFSMDARNRVDDLIRKKAAGEQVPVFDCIFGDSINDYSVPYHLTTAEFNKNIRELLKPDGIYMLNLIDMLDSGQFLAAVVNACRTVWPNVYVFSSFDNPKTRDTFIVVSSARELSLDEIPSQLTATYGGYRGRMLPREEVDALVARTGNHTLTDDFAPVDNMLRPVVQFSRDVATDSLIRTAEMFVGEGNFGAAIRRARRAIGISPDSAKAYEMLGYVYGQKGDLDRACENLRKAVGLDPSCARALSRLADVLQKKGDTAGLIDTLENLEAVDPAYEGLCGRLVAAYTEAQRYDEAWAVANDAQAQGRMIDTETMNRLILDSGRTQAPSPAAGEFVSVDPQPGPALQQSTGSL